VIEGDECILVMGVVDMQSFGSGEQMPGLRADVDELTSMTVAGVDVKKSRRVKLCAVSDTVSRLRSRCVHS